MVSSSLSILNTSDKMVSRVLEEYGMEVFLELNDLMDIDLHHATEDTIRTLSRKGITSAVLSVLI